MNPAEQRLGDYDQDGDGLIEITTLAQLDAMRYDLNGNGDATDAEYAAAFPSRITAAAARMGCPSGACVGYELAAHLDFDTDGDGSTYTGSGDSATGDSGDAYYNGGEGWVNLGGSGSGRNFDTTFRGNGYTIANLFIKRTGAATAGLFGTISPSARIESVGVVDGYVYGGAWSGILVGTNFGTVAGSYTTGEVLVTLYTGGGLVGLNNGDGGNTGEIIASYSHANVAAGGAGSASDMGGLAGFVTRGSKITASYSTGTVTTTGGNRAGFMSGGSTIAASDIEVSYWDTTTTNIADDVDSDMPEGVSSVNLKAPTGYTGIYASWNVDVDGTTGGDDPWHFGGTSTYPALKYGGHDPYRQTGDYDTDDDGLIEIWTPDRLNAVRWDLDGDAVQDATSAADWAKRGAAFPNALPSLGCPDTAADADSDPGPCTGYELARDLDFTDANGDGEAGVDRVYRVLDADRERDERLQRNVRRQQQDHLAPENRGGGRGRVHRLVRQLVRHGDENGLAGRRSERNRRGFGHAYRRASWRAERQGARQLVDRDGDADGRKRRRYRRLDRLLVRRRRNRELVGRARDVKRGVRQRGRLDREHEKRAAERGVLHRRRHHERRRRLRRRLGGRAADARRQLVLRLIRDGPRDQDRNRRRGGRAVRDGGVQHPPR